MKKILFLVILLITLSVSYSQDYDLIVTIQGDSIACKIDSITNTHIYFEMRIRYNWIHTNMEMNKVSEFKESVLDRNTIRLKLGTSIILPFDQLPPQCSMLEKLSQEELNICLDKALKLKKDGGTVTIIGVSTIGAGFLVGLVGPGNLGTVAVAGLMGIAGLGTMAVGIPMRITGKKRVERINAIKSTAYNGISIDLKPCAQYNFINQKYQPAITLRINF